MRKVAQQIWPLRIDYGTIRGSPGAAAMSLGFGNRGILIPENDVCNTGYSGTGGGPPSAPWGRKCRRRPAGKPEWPRVFPVATAWDWGPPARRRPAEIPGLIGINSNGKLPESGASNYQGDFPGNRMSIQLPGKFAGKSQGPGAPANYPGNRSPRPGPREIPRGIPATSGAASGFPCFLPFWDYRLHIYCRVQTTW